MTDQAGALRHGYNVGRILVLLTVYVVALTFGTIFTGIRKAFARVRATGGRLLDRTRRRSRSSRS